MKRRSVLLGIGATSINLALPGQIAKAAAATRLNASNFDPSELDIDALLGAFERGLSSEELLEAYLKRIERLDQAGPDLRSVLAINPAARANARQLDAERRSGTLRGPLHGIPIIIKDNIETADPLATTAGSIALAHAKHSNDAALVARLRAAGAVILGKANLSEWANFRSTRSMSGWSSAGGQTRNAYDPLRNPSGSSSGSAVAAAASFCAVAIGTETDGSILSPAALNGIVGFKPTQTRVSGAGIVPLSPRQDVAGPMARTVRDAARIAAIIFEDSLDIDPVLDLSTEPLRGCRIGVWPAAPGLRKEVAERYGAVQDVLRAAGAVLVELSIPAGLQQYGATEYTALLYEFKDALDRYLANLSREQSPVSSLIELMEFNRQHAAQVMPHFGQEIFEQAAECGPLTDTKYLEAVELLRVSVDEQGLGSLFDTQQLRLMIAPGSGPAELIDHVWGNRRDTGGAALGSAAAVAGYPSLTLPIGLVRSLPLGLTMVAPRNADTDLLACAAALEAAAQLRQAPQFLR